MNIPDDLFHRIASLLSLIQSSCKGCYYTSSSKCVTCLAVPAKGLCKEIALSRDKGSGGISLNRHERTVLRYIRDNTRPNIYGVKIHGVEAYEKRRAIKRLLDLKLITVETATTAGGKPACRASVNRRSGETIARLLGRVG